MSDQSECPVVITLKLCIRTSDQSPVESCLIQPAMEQIFRFWKTFHGIS
jgi:hypothetical protein